MFEIGHYFNVDQDIPSKYRVHFSNDDVIRGQRSPTLSNALQRYTTQCGEVIALSR